MEIILPKNESRKFSGGQLDNDIKYINVQDENLDKSYVMVSVNIGCLSDPVEYQGLAHFLEHMLFLGSKKYPGENQFERFLNENGGYSNAYTATFETVYYFSIYNDKLDKAIDMFSRFFIDPLFDEDSVNREINAIQSEHNKNIQQDIWRASHFFGLISKENSIINKFGTGSLDTLKKDGVREKMIEFYNKYYVSSNINITTVSSLENSRVSSFLQESFSNISKKYVEKFKVIKPFYDIIGKNYFLKSVSKDHNLIYLWEIPENKSNYLDTHSPNIISDVITSSNENSFYNVLINKGLIKNVFCSVNDEGVFVLNIKLSKLENWKEVDSYTRFFINDLKNHNWNKIAEYELKKDKLLFDYSSKDESEELGLKLVTNLIYYPIERCYIGTHVINKINVEQIKSLLTDYLTFEKANVILSSDLDLENINLKNVGIKIKNIKTEPHYKLEYSKIDIKFDTPKPFKYEIISDNPFLDTKPKLIKGLDTSLIPTIFKVGNNNVWFGNVSKFNETNIYCDLIFTNIDFVSSLENFINTLLLVKYVNERINKEFSLASEIGFRSYLIFDMNNSIIFLKIKGHNDKFKDYFNMINSFIKNFEYDEKDDTMIKVLLESTKENYINIKNENPWNYSAYLEDLNTNKNSFKIDDVVNYLNNLDVKQFTKTISESKNRILYQSKFTTFIYGNTIFKELFDSDKNIEILFPSVEKSKNILDLLSDINCQHPNKDEKENFLQLTHYIGKFNPYDNLMLLILTISFGERFFDEIRTKQQFGYLVSSSSYKNQSDYYFRQRVQSSKSIDEISKAILKFNNEFINKISEEDFNKFLITAKNIINEKQNSTEELFRKYLPEIYNNTFMFEREKLLLNKIKDVTFEKFKKFYNDKVINGNTTKFIIKGNSK
jgi:insulysin